MELREEDLGIALWEHYGFRAMNSLWDRRCGFVDRSWKISGQDRQIIIPDIRN